MNSSTSNSKLVDTFKEFLTAIQQRGILKKVNQILELHKGSLANSRDKLESNTSGLIGVDNLPLKLSGEEKDQSLDIFYEELMKCQDILTDIEKGIAELNLILLKLEERVKGQINILQQQEIYCFLSSFEDCQEILKYLELRTKVIKYDLLIPPGEKANQPNSLKIEEAEDHYFILIAKLEHFVQEF